MNTNLRVESYRRATGYAKGSKSSQSFELTCEEDFQGVCGLEGAKILPSPGMAVVPAGGIAGGGDDCEFQLPEAEKEIL